MLVKREPVRGFSLAGFFFGLGLPFLYYSVGWASSQACSSSSVISGMTSVT